MLSKLLVKSFQKTTGRPHSTIWWSARSSGRLGPQDHPNFEPARGREGGSGGRERGDEGGEGGREGGRGMTVIHIF